MEVIYLILISLGAISFTIFIVNKFKKLGQYIIVFIATCSIVGRHLLNDTIDIFSSIMIIVLCISIISFDFYRDREGLNR